MTSGGVQNAEMGSVLTEREARLQSARRIGGKAYGLCRLLEANLPVPTFCVLPTDAYVQDRRESPLQDPIVSDQIVASILSLVGVFPGPPELVAVRSSAAEEDSEKASFAGQFKTVL